MKLPARDIATYCAKPDPNRAGVLIYGAPNPTPIGQGF